MIQAAVRETSLRASPKLLFSGKVDQTRESFGNRAYLRPFLFSHTIFFFWIVKTKSNGKVKHFFYLKQKHILQCIRPRFLPYWFLGLCLVASRLHSKDAGVPGLFFRDLLWFWFLGFDAFDAKQKKRTNYSMRLLKYIFVELLKQ